MSILRYKTINIDLNSGKSNVIQEPINVQKKYIGGRTLGIYKALKDKLYLYNPLNPKNAIYILTGPGTGTISGGGGTAMITRSPLTGGINDSLAQSKFGVVLKKSGLDGIRIIGKCKSLSYLFIDNKKALIEDASEIKGKSVEEVEQYIKDKHGDTDISIISIGVAGENLVRYAAAISENRAYGRGGSGAVMGAKNIKAIAVKGCLEIQYYDKKVLNNEVKKIINTSQSKDTKYEKHRIQGTAFMYKKHCDVGIMSGLNYTNLSYGDEKIINLGNQVISKTIKDGSACFKCGVMCARKAPFTIEGKEKEASGPEFETIWAFGPQVGNSNPAIVIEADYLCDQYGLDTISTGNVIGHYIQFLMKQNKSVGEGKILELLKNIAYRKNEGNILAEGVKITSKKLKTQNNAMHVKGMELPAYDPRGFYGIALAYAISSRGGCHRKAFCPEEAGLKVPGDSIENKAYYVAKEEEMIAIRDTYSACKWATLGASEPYYRNVLFGATGIEKQETEMESFAKMSVSLAREFNVRAGVTIKDDTLPERFFTEKKKTGPLKGARIERDKFEQLKATYYNYRGWKDGKPKLNIT